MQKDTKTMDVTSSQYWDLLIVYPAPEVVDADGFTAEEDPNGAELVMSGVAPTRESAIVVVPPTTRPLEPSLRTWPLMVSAGPPTERVMPSIATSPVSPGTAVAVTSEPPKVNTTPLSVPVAT